VHLTAEQCSEGEFQTCQVHHAAPWVELDQEVNVATGPSVASRYRPEDPHPSSAAPISQASDLVPFPPQLSQARRDRPALLMGFHRATNVPSRAEGGRPLTSQEVVVNLIGATTTTSGLKLHAEHDPGSYPTGAQVTDHQVAAVGLSAHQSMASGTTPSSQTATEPNRLRNPYFDEGPD
jgi:hypothetical protein